VNEPQFVTISNVIKLHSAGVNKAIEPHSAAPCKVIELKYVNVSKFMSQILLLSVR
jgi:hypothetical protein